MLFEGVSLDFIFDIQKRQTNMTQTGLNVDIALSFFSPLSPGEGQDCQRPGGEDASGAREEGEEAGGPGGERAAGSGGEAATGGAGDC